MAEVTAMRNNALPYPVYGAPWTLVFPILDADGDLVSGAAATEDSEVSKNGDTFTNCTNDIIEIDTTGMYYLTLTGTEMTADVVAVIAKAGGTAKTTPMVMYPRKLVTLRTGTSQGGAAGYITLDANAGAIDDMWNGCLCVATIDGNVEARIITDYVGSSKQASVTPSWNVTPDADDTFIIYLPEGVQIHVALLSPGTGTGQISLSSGAVTAGTVSDKTGYALADTTSDAVIADAVWNAATATYGTSNTYGALIESGNVGGGAIVAASVSGSVGSVTGAVGSVGSGGITAASFAADAITATVIAANAIGASELADDAANEIADALLLRNIAGGSSTGRLVREALYPLRNRVSVSGGIMTVYQVDDNTSSWTASVTTTEGANPITAINPDGGSA